jgi:hypothetical protein
MRKRLSMSRRTAAWLMAVLAALVVVHYAYRNVPTALTRAVTGVPALQVALRGEITQLSPNAMTVTLEDSHGDLTQLTRHVVLTQDTQFVTLGKPSATGSRGYSYLQTGYRVLIRGQGTVNNDIIAQVVNVSFPPLNGTVTQVNQAMLTLAVKGQPQPANILLTSHTAFFVPGGQWNSLKIGAPVKVWVVPNQVSGSGLTAITVMVTHPTTATP